jgi:acyl-CoA synthetase (AMP-forming)/AMP-acid ligase II
VRLQGEALEPLDVTLPDVIARVEGGTAAVFGSRKLSYEEMRERSLRLAAGLVRCGVRPGDRVAVLATNCPEFMIVFCAVSHAGAVLVPLNARLKPPELHKVLAHSGASVAIGQESFRSHRYAETLRKLAPELPDLRHVLSTDDLRRIERSPFATSLPEVAPDDPFVILYTSGTTGLPKGCVHTHRTLLTNAWVNARLKALDADDRVIASVPFFNGFGIINCQLECFLTGATIVGQPVFEPARTLFLLEHEAVTVLLGSPTMWVRLLEHRDYAATDLSRLRAGTMCGSVAPPSVLDEWRRPGRKVVDVYGLSEAPSVLADGLPTAGVEVEVSDDGELLARGYNRMVGYFRDDEATAARIQDGWVRSGDLVEVGEDGRLRITGRADDMLVVGGFNVHPAEIENLLRTHPAVADVAAFGVPDQELGEAPAAWVVLRDNARATAEQLRDHCAGGLAAYKVPTELELVDDLPLTANGKVQRFVMRDSVVRAREARGAAAAL